MEIGFQSSVVFLVVTNHLAWQLNIDWLIQKASKIPRVRNYLLLVIVFDIEVHFKWLPFNPLV